MLNVDWQGLILPVAYLLVLGGTFATFSTVYRKRKAAQSANLSPWFPPHLQRNIYLSLLHLEPEEGSSGDKKKAAKVPDSVLRAALLRRAVEDIHRIIQIRTGKQACATLLQRGSVGDDLWQRFSRAEKEMEDELRDVVVEANALVPNWGQIIFQTANAIAGNALLRAKLEAVQAQVDGDKAWWAQRKDAIARDLLAEEGAAPAAVVVPKADSTAKKPSTPTTTTTTSTDDDAVLVDAQTPSSTTTTTTTNTNTNTTPSTTGRKKKGKK